MDYEYYSEVTPSLPVLLYTTQDLVQKGWEVDPDRPAGSLGFSHQGHFRRVLPPPVATFNGPLVSEDARPARKPGRQPRQEKK